MIAAPIGVALGGARAGLQAYQAGDFASIRSVENRPIREADYGILLSSRKRSGPLRRQLWRVWRKPLEADLIPGEKPAKRVA